MQALKRYLVVKGRELSLTPETFPGSFFSFFRITSICGLFPFEHILRQHPFLSLAIFFLLTPSSLPSTVSPNFSPFFSP